jgi:predicted enzyme related to lactoylglutathione lyase
MRIKHFAPGRFCWADLAVPDLKKSIGFYTELLGCTAQAVDDTKRGGYTLLKKGNAAVAGIYPMQKERARRGEKAHWLSYVSTDDIERAAAKVVALGGQIQGEPVAVGTDGHACSFRDPQGVTLSLWQPHKFAGASIWNEPGAICWNELVAASTDPSWRFYSRLFGWEANDRKMRNLDYTVFKLGNKPVAGLMPINAKLHAVGKQWVTFFAVPDCEHAVDMGLRMGAAALLPPATVPQLGRIAIIEDRAGAAVGLVGPA